MNERPLESRVIEGALVLGTTARLTRLVVKDDLGEWWLKDPIEDALAAYEYRHERKHPLERYASGLDCPWCVGFHIGWAVMAITEATRDTRLQRPWRAVMTALTLNAAMVGVGGKLDYWE